MPIKDKPDFDEKKESIKEILVDGKIMYKVELLPKDEVKPMEARPQEQFKPEPTEKEKFIVVEDTVKTMQNDIIAIKKKLGL